MIFGNKFKKDKCPFDTETKDKIKVAINKCCEKIEKDYKQQLKYMKKNNPEELAYINLDKVSFLEPNVDFNYSDSIAVDFTKKVNQDVFYAMQQHNKCWYEIGDRLKSAVNNVTPIKKIQLVDDDAIVVLVYKL